MCRQCVPLSKYPLPLFGVGRGRGGGVELIVCPWPKRIPMTWGYLIEGETKELVSLLEKREDLPEGEVQGEKVHLIKFGEGDLYSDHLALSFRWSEEGRWGHSISYSPTQRRRCARA